MATHYATFHLKNLHFQITLYKYLAIDLLYQTQDTFPVKRSHSRPSGKGSPLGFAAGSSFWHSGIDKPLKRIPWRKWKNGYT